MNLLSLSPQVSFCEHTDLTVVERFLGYGKTPMVTTCLSQEAKKKNKSPLQKYLLLFFLGVEGNGLVVLFLSFQG